LSRGVGAAVSDKKLIDYAVDELTKITGQKRYLHFKERCCIFKRKGSIAALLCRKKNEF
jgi:ribosomal protein L5